MAANSPHFEGLSGTTTILWGTEGSFGLTGAIVESLAITPKNAGPIGMALPAMIRSCPPP